MYRYLVIVANGAIGSWNYHSAYKGLKEAKRKIRHVQLEVGIHNSFNPRIHLIDMKTGDILQEYAGICSCVGCRPRKRISNIHS